MMNLHILSDPDSDFWKCPKKGLKKSYLWSFLVPNVDTRHAPPSPSVTHVAVPTLWRWLWMTSSYRGNSWLLLSAHMSAHILSCTVLYCTVLYCTVLYCTVLYCTVLYCTVLYCTVLYCTVLYCTVLYCTVLYRTVLFPTTSQLRIGTKTKKIVVVDIDHVIMIVVTKRLTFLGKAHLKNNTHFWASVPTGGGVWPNPNLLDRFSQVTEINCPNSKTKCPSVD